jgi:hypothetical protein
MEVIGRPLIIRIEEGYRVASRQFQETIAGRCDSAVFTEIIISRGVTGMGLRKCRNQALRFVM